MKKLFVFLFAIVMGIGAAWAQCTPDFNQPNPGFAPEPDSIDCIVQGEYTEFTIFFKNFADEVWFSQQVHVDSIHIDSINNLPCGLSWTTNKPTGVFVTSETGCIAVAGTTTDGAGTYELKIIVTAWINGQGFPVQQNAEVIDLGYYVRVIANASDACLPGDTTQATATATCVSSPWTGIYEYGIDAINGMTITPNPFQGVATVTFTSQNTADYTATLYDVTGKAVVKEEIDVTAGQNRIQLNRQGLSPGVYLYTISDGVHTQTQRVIITE